MNPRIRTSAASFGYKLVAVLFAAGITIAVQRGWLPSSTSSTSSPVPTATPPARPTSAAPSAVRELFHAKRSDTWVETTGRVEKLLPDDTDTRDNSDKHQKFLLLVPGDITVLVAHNINAARRVPVRPGDSISLRGEYEYTEKGGTVHFTHKPKYNAHNKQGGWIEFKGTRYE